MGGSKPAKNEMKETALSKKQVEILRDRENFLNSFTVPELKEHLQQVKELEFQDNYKLTPKLGTMYQNIAGIQQQFDQAEDQLSLSLAKRGMEGSGIEATTLTQLAGAEANALGKELQKPYLQTIFEKNAIADSRNQQAMAKQGYYQSAVQNILSLSPTPTGSAPQRMMQKPGKASPLGATLSGGMQGASIGGQAGGPWGAVAGAVIGGGVGYASAT